MEYTMATGYIAAISRGHNSGVCLLKDGKIVFAIEEERLSRRKYDGSPFAAMNLIKQYTDKIDHLIIVHTHPRWDGPKLEYMPEDVYTGLARKMGLIDRNATVSSEPVEYLHPQVSDYHQLHHKTHAACAFYRSGFDDAVAVVADGAGSLLPMNFEDKPVSTFEVESIYNCSYPFQFDLLYKHYATSDSIPTTSIAELPNSRWGEEGSHEAVISDCPGITKVYEAVSEYCGFEGIEAGKTMGLFPYGKPNKEIPPLFVNVGNTSIANRNLFSPRYPSSAIVNHTLVPFLAGSSDNDLSLLENRRDLAYACQKETQDQLVNLIRKAVKMSGKKNVVLSGGYGLNCVANYYYLNKLKDDGINLYVEPISNDGGTAIGGALLYYYTSTASIEKQPPDVYLGPQYTYTESQIKAAVEVAGGELTDATNSDVVKLLREKNIVTIFQGRSENGPRALGNRSVLFDPTFEDGKDFVNSVKHREYFRPFAGTILQDHVHGWFDLRGMESSPHMMYAVNCKPGVKEKIPGIIHVDGTCRIQTVTREENKHYYELIEEYYKVSGVPIIFNTSFNLGGEPLVETLEDAITTLEKSDIEYLYMPEYGKLIKIANVK